MRDKLKRHARRPRSGKRGIVRYCWSPKGSLYQCSTFEVVASLERVETQYALMGQKLSEAVEAMGRIQTKVEEMKRDLEITTREKMDLESRKAELISELEVVFSSSECLDTFHLGTFKVCSMRLENLGEVNSSCKEKLGELEVCKSEIGRLADVVEKRFSQVVDENVFFWNL